MKQNTIEMVMIKVPETTEEIIRVESAKLELNLAMENIINQLCGKHSLHMIVDSRIVIGICGCDPTCYPIKQAEAKPGVKPWEPVEVNIKSGKNTQSSYEKEN